MDTIDYQGTYERLLAVRGALMQDKPLPWFLDCHGLCANFMRCCLDGVPPLFSLHDACSEMWKEWPLYSGNEDYPVPAGNMQPMAAYNDLYDNMYNTDTEYGRNRWALLDYLIERVYGRLPNSS